MPRQNTTVFEILHVKRLQSGVLVARESVRVLHPNTICCSFIPAGTPGIRTDNSTQSQQAYQHGDKAAAHELSAESKQHAAYMDQYNKQASDFIFRENNAPGRVADDTIDLHGQFVEEAEQILEQRIRYGQQNGQTHLHV
jgi:DNA-nicking Smr family endonuclease